MHRNLRFENLFIVIYIYFRLPFPQLSDVRSEMQFVEWRQTLKALSPDAVEIVFRFATEWPIEQSAIDSQFSTGWCEKGAL